MNLNCEQLREELFLTKKQKETFDLLLQDFKPSDLLHHGRVYISKREIEAQIKYIGESIFNPEKIKKELAQFFADNMPIGGTRENISQTAEKMVRDYTFIDKDDRLLYYNKDIRISSVMGPKFPEQVALSSSSKLKFDDCEDLSLPEVFITYGDLSIDNCPSVIMPRRRDVKGSLLIRDSFFNKLPEHIKANSLFLVGTNFTELPELDVFGALSIRGTNITELPSGLKLEGLLDIRDTLITRLPNDLRVAGGLLIDKRLEVQAQMLVDKGQVSHFEF